MPCCVATAFYGTTRQTTLINLQLAVIVFAAAKSREPVWPSPERNYKYKHQEVKVNILPRFNFLSFWDGHHNTIIIVPRNKTPSLHSPPPQQRWYCCTLRSSLRYPPRQNQHRNSEIHPGGLKSGLIVATTREILFIPWEAFLVVRSGPSTPTHDDVVLETRQERPYGMIRSWMLSASP